MMRYKVSAAVILFFLSLSIYPGSSSAAPYYAGKVITIVVSYGPGGGHDRIARILAKHLPNHIPGKPTVLIQNMPGADSLIAANYLYNVAKPDGLTIGTFSRGLPFAQLAKIEGIRFDVTKYAWIGSFAVEGMILFIRADLPYKTFADLQKVTGPIAIGGTGVNDPQGIFPVLLKEFLGLKMKMITYPSSGDITLALERKEIDGRAGSYVSVKPLILRGLVRPLIRDRVAEPGSETLPVNEDLTLDKKGKTMMAMLSTVDRISRPYLAPPGTPEVAMNALRNAFAQMAKSPEVQEDVKKVGMAVEYVSAPEVQKVLRYLLDQPPDITNEFAKYLK